MSRLREIKRTIKTLEAEGEPSAPPWDERIEYHTRLADLYLESSKIYLKRATVTSRMAITLAVGLAIFYVVRWLV